MRTRMSMMRGAMEPSLSLGEKTGAMACSCVARWPYRAMSLWMEMGEQGVGKEMLDPKG
jgi:hypothetical protein